MPEKAHQPGNLGLGAFPVLGRKGKNGQIVDAQIRTGAHYLANAFYADMVAE